MRLLVTGVDQTGRSCAAQDGPIELHCDASIDGMLYSMLYASPSVPPIDDGGRAACKLDLVLPPGALRWTMIEYAPGAEFSMHHTDTVDFDVVLSGSVDLVLDDGDHLLEPGDSAVITGVDHAWRAGPRGCRLEVLTIAALASRPASGVD
ncbi:cupin domain-containing protein [Mycobacterium simiae]|uniref:cupin domain-containing protein n=1 Tax=Mycobacterium simiae TaxID=1784 RepID=UPI0026364E45|nr:cupin domain-containing protein [Mycobacterium simiae]